MTEQKAPEKMSQAEQEARIKQWNSQEYVKVQKYCLSQGVQLKGLDQKHCQCLPPLIGIWYVNSSTKGEDYWVISGDLPTDLAPVKVAKNARQALRHFSMSWQLKATNMQETQGQLQLSDKETQQKYCNELIEKAEAIYRLYSDDKIWAGSGQEA